MLGYLKKIVYSQYYLINVNDKKTCMENQNCLVVIWFQFGLGFWFLSSCLVKFKPGELLV